LGATPQVENKCHKGCVAVEKVGTKTGGLGGQTPTQTLPEPSGCTNVGTFTKLEL